MSKVRPVELESVIDIFDKLQKDAKDNGISMFNANDSFVNNQNMLPFFHQFIKKYVFDSNSKMGPVVPID